MNQFDLIKKLIDSEFFKASFWVFLATGVLNAGNYFYHLIMGRMLGPQEYGVLESVISLFYIISIPFIPLTLVVVKFVSSYKGKKDKDAIASFYIYMRDKVLIYGAAVALILLIGSPVIMNFLHLSNIYFPILISLGFFVGLLAMLVKGTLQGIFNFFALFVANTVEITIKILVAIVLVYFGFKALGAVFAVTASFLIGLIIAFFFLKKEKFIGKNNFKEGKDILKYSVPVFLTSLGLTSLFTTDIILVRNLFSGIESGYYAALSVLGKIIFFGTFPITIVLFPLVSERHAANKDYKSLLAVSVTVTIAIAGFILGIYYLFPQAMVDLLFGREFSKIAPLLAIFGVFIAIYSLSSVIANFYLSIHKTKISIFVILASILQILLISFFHRSLLEVIYMSIISTSLLLLALIIYYPFAMGKKKRV